MEKITEDYCSQEVVKLLNEKGFKIKQYYNCLINMWQDIKVTHQMAMKWLREKHNLSIWISLRRPNMGLPYCYELHSISTGEVIHIGGFNFGSYEQAVEAALKYCLMYLI